MVVMLQNVSAQDLKVKEIKPYKLTDVSYPRDFNDDFCALVLLKMPKGEVSFEGNIISNVSYIGDAYRIFLTKGTKYLNVKRKGANSLMINFSNFEISLQGGKCYQVVLEIPEVKEALPTFSEENWNISEEAEKLYQQAVASMNSNKYNDYLDLLKKASALNHPKALYGLGDMYSCIVWGQKTPSIIKIPGWPVDRDYQKAFGYYLQSAKLGYVKGQYKVAECYSHGKGVKKNKEEASAWYEKAEKNGHVSEASKIGNSDDTNSSKANDDILNVQGMELVNTDLSASVNERKDKNGHSCALVKVKFPFDNVKFGGKIVGKALFKTNEYWIYVSDGADYIEIEYENYPKMKANFANYKSGKPIAKRTYELYVSYPIELLGTNNLPDGITCYKIAQGYNDREKYLQALKWAEKGAEQGNSSSMLLASILLQQAKGGVERNMERHLYWLEKACDANEPQALNALASYYMYGIGGKKYDYEKSQELYKRAAQLGNVAAKQMIGVAKPNSINRAITRATWNTMYGKSTKTKKK